jgi:hypothetical protein
MLCWCCLLQGSAWPRALCDPRTDPLGVHFTLLGHIWSECWRFCFSWELYSCQSSPLLIEGQDFIIKSWTNSKRAIVLGPDVFGNIILLSTQEPSLLKSQLVLCATCHTQSLSSIKFSAWFILFIPLSWFSLSVSLVNFTVITWDYSTMDEHTAALFPLCTEFHHSTEKFTETS